MIGLAAAMRSFSTGTRTVFLFSSPSYSAATPQHSPAAPWRDLAAGWQVVFYMLILGGAVRFVHFSLFGGTLLSCLLCRRQRDLHGRGRFYGFRAARAAQMVTQYRWINAPDGRLRWRRKPH